MTQDEFQVFLTIHNANFPGFLAWFLGENRTDSPEELRVRGQSWLNGLRHATLDECQFTSMELLYASEKPDGFSHHLSWIRDAVARFRASKRGPEQVCRKRKYQCDICQDSGFVTVTTRSDCDPNNTPFSAGGIVLHPGTWYAVRCECGFAPNYQADYRGPKLDRFDRDRHAVRREVDRDANWERIERLREEGKDKVADQWGRFIGGKGAMPKARIGNN